MDVVRAHHEYGGSVIARDGAAFARRLEELLVAYDPATVAVQLNLLGSHDAPRLRTIVGGDATRVRLAILLQATLPGAPCLYYGDEVGLTGGMDPHCRGAFPWDSSRWEPGLHDTVRALFRLRQAEPALRDGPFRVVGAREAAVAYERGSGAARFVVVVNPGDSAVQMPLRFADAPPGHGGHLAPVTLPGLGGVGEAPIVDGTATLDVAARSGGIVRVV
jgi:glycosidase